MTGAKVLDASVAVKCLIDETGSEAARRAVAAHTQWIAPDLIYLEVASVAVTAVRRGLIEASVGHEMVAALPSLLIETVAGDALAPSAFRLAAAHSFSAYDAAYLALACEHDCSVLTADRRLCTRAQAAGLHHLVQLL